MRLYGPGFLALAILLLFPACARKLETQVQDAVRQLDDANLKRRDIEVVDVRKTGSSAVAEVKIRTGVQLQLKDGEWEVEDIRIGDRKWEKAAHLVAALQAERIRTTKELLEKLDTAIHSFEEANGKVPQVDTFESLIDQLVTRYLNEPIRLDAWSRTFSYRFHNNEFYELRSAGPDGILDNADDLTKGNVP